MPDPSQDLLTALADNAQPEDASRGTNLAQMTQMIQQAGKKSDVGQSVQDRLDNAPPLMTKPAQEAPPPGTYIGMSGKPVPLNAGGQVSMDKAFQTLWQKGVAADAGIPVNPDSVDVTWGHLPKRIRDQYPQALGQTQLVGWRWDDLKDHEKALLAQLVAQGEKERQDKLSQMDKLEILRKSLAERAD